MSFRQGSGIGHASSPLGPEACHPAVIMWVRIKKFIGRRGSLPALQIQKKLSGHTLRGKTRQNAEILSNFPGERLLWILADWQHGSGW